MPIIARDNPGTYTPAPEGLHVSVCCDVVDLGLVEGPWGPKPQVEVRWQIDEDQLDSGKPYEVRQRYGLSLHKKAKLRQHLEAWRGRAFNEEELKGFDLEKLLTVSCQIQVVHNLSKNGSTFANV